MNVRGLLSILLLILAIGTSSTARAAEEAASCYKIYKNDGPEAMAAYSRRIEIWCYQELIYPVGSVYVYNADNDEVRPELAMLIEADGMITHGSLLNGELSIHRVNRNEFNPLGAPLAPPADATRMPIEDEKIKTSARSTLDLFLKTPSEPAHLGLNDIHVAKVEKASASYLPWRGYWWSYKGQRLWHGANAPLSKYDRFVTARTGTNPGAAAWESIHHRYHGVWWEGHCNGWAASSILRSEPKAPRRDPVSGATFGVADQKGLYAVVDYCTNTAFYGHRNRGGGDMLDIYPALFHKTLRYYIGELKKPVIFDYHADAPVDNHVISAYSMTITATGTNTYDVTTVLNVHRYDSSVTDVPGVAPMYTRTYRYSLTTDNAGNPTGGAWKSANPDFIWVPLGPAECDSNNANVDSKMVGQIMSL